MNEEFIGNLEVTGTEEVIQENVAQEEIVYEEVQAEEIPEEHIPETVHAEPVIEVTSEVQPEAIMTQAEDGSWRHAENSPFSPFYVPDRKQKSNNRITIGLVILLLVLLIGGLIFAVSKLVEAAVGEAEAAWSKSTGAVEEFLSGMEDSFNNKEKEVPVPDKEEEPDIQDFPNYLLPQEPELPDSYEDYMEDFLKRYYGDEYGSEFGYGVPGYGGADEYEEDEFDYGEEYVPSPDDEYYVELANAIRDDLSYSAEIKEYAYSDFENSVYISVWYAQISDDIPNSDRINKDLKDNAMYYAYMFEAEGISDLTLEAESFITYMDEERLSVVVSEYYYLYGEVMYNLYCMNYDLTTGTLLDNAQMIEVSDDLVEAFVEQSIYQNGHTYSVSDYSNEQIAAFMKDELSLIVFYTPVGLEIGYNHPDGWVTATLKDYSRFLKKI